MKESISLQNLCRKHVEIFIILDYSLEVTNKIFLAFENRSVLNLPCVVGVAFNLYGLFSIPTCVQKLPIVVPNWKTLSFFLPWILNMWTDGQAKID